MNVHIVKCLNTVYVQERTPRNPSILLGIPRCALYVYGVFANGKLGTINFAGRTEVHALTGFHCTTVESGYQVKC